MIQEILDYLLIRSLLYNSDSEELIDAVVKKEDFVYVLNNIYLLMQEEDFLLTSPHLVTSVLDFIQKYRFDYNKDKEINDKMNYIIGRLNDYRNMSDKRKKSLINVWIKEESERRNLPLCYQYLDNLLNFISLDTYYLKNMMLIDEVFTLNNLVEYISIINIIMNKYPEFFIDNPEFLEVTRQNLKSLKNNKEIKRIDSKMIRRTFKQMEKQYQLSENENFQKVIKKTEK